MSVAAAERDAGDLSVIEQRAVSVARMFLDRVEQTPDREAYRYPRADTWESLTWRETGQQVRRLAAGLVALGVEPEQRVAIASSTRYEWILADLAVMCAGAATTTVYPATEADDATYIVRDSQSRVLFAEDDEQVQKFRERTAEMPALTKIVAFDGTTDSDGVISLAALERLGVELLERSPGIVDERVAGIKSSDLATLIYTSGTTGLPKGVRLPHSCWTYEGAAVDALDILSIADLQYLWLPMAHSFGKVLLTAQLQIGFPTAVDGRVDKIIDNLAVVQPTFMGAAPRIFEKVYGRILTTAHAGGGAKAKLFDRAFTVGLAVARARRAGQRVPPLLAAQHKVFDRLVFAKIRDRFGGRLRFFISGAAALNADVAEWFHAAGILILEGYGLTETSAGSCVNLPRRLRIGSVGHPLPGTEVRLATDNEILIRGPGVMAGYHGIDEATRESLSDDGWFHTGDIGTIDTDGFVHVTDRKKDLFKTSGGKYVAPQVIEARFKGLCPYASQFLVYGQGRSYCTGIVALDPESLEQWAAAHDMAGQPYAELVASAPVRDLVQGYIDELNGRLNRWETIKRFILLDHDMTVESGEVTPSLKLKRKAVEDNYADQLDALYR
jgi:long-chain acyl-CoA synthetase